MVEQPQPDSRWRWAFRGMIVGGMLFWAANAASYFLRSTSYSNLHGPVGAHVEAIGFPVEIWRQGETYAGQLIDYRSVGINAAIGMVFSLLVAAVMVRYHRRLQRMIADFEASSADRESRSVQFSIRGLMIGTALVAAVVAAVTNWAGTAELTRL